MQTTIKAYSKINLSLDVCGILPEGYHSIDSIMAPTPIFDRLDVSSRLDKSVSIIYAKGASFQNDTVLQMAKLIMEKYNTPGINVFIEKNIPMGLGLGGSSADAAGIAKAMRDLYLDEEVDLELMSLVGSDVPAIYAGETLRVKGKGEITAKIELPADIYMVVMWKEGVVSSTASVYREYDNIGGEHGSIDQFLKDLKPFNSLERAAVSLTPDMTGVRQHLEAVNFDNVVLTGSGSAYIGYSTDKARFMDSFEKLKTSVERDKYFFEDFMLNKKGRFVVDYAE